MLTLRAPKDPQRRRLPPKRRQQRTVSVNTLEILERLYRVEPLKRHRFRRVRRLYSRALDWVQEHSGRLSLITLAFGLWLVTHVYYYNELTRLEYDVKAAWAQVESVQQKRSHIQRNLVRLVTYYSSHERKLMTDVTRLRGESMERSAGKSSPQELLARLNAVAEQYPALKLGESVRQLSNAIMTTESEIAANIQVYNQAVNIYTTVLNQFPGMIFGPTLGFEDMDFYTPQDKSKLEFREVEP